MRTLLLSICLSLGTASGMAQQATPAAGTPAAGSPAAGSPAAGSPAAGSPPGQGMPADRQTTPATPADPAPASPRAGSTPPDRQQAPAVRPAVPTPATEGARTPPAEHGRKAVPPRRRGLQVPQHVPLVGPAPPTYGPVLGTPLPPVPLQPGVASGPAGLPPPAQINSCVGNLCTDSTGATYNSGAGNAAVNGQGRLCNRVGNTMQCF